MQNKAMLIGAIGVGKSTLTNALLGKTVPAIKTQTLTYYDWIVDTPGEYTENPLFYKNIMATALEVTHILYLQDSTSYKKYYPPAFSTGFGKLPIGVITKKDHPHADIEQALKNLTSIIVSGPIVIVSAMEADGIEHIKKLVSMNTMEEMRIYANEQLDDHLLFIQ
ncbi:MAG TPA: EutP/PduV family microcompartment system protein [Rummeliibacillus sp.]|nr:EutP/PduV family microcompartment system protein [Rummeliibacillus sp.]